MEEQQRCICILSVSMLPGPAQPPNKSLLKQSELVFEEVNISFQGRAEACQAEDTAWVEWSRAGMGLSGAELEWKARWVGRGHRWFGNMERGP